MTPNQRDVVYVVVHVSCGIAVDAACFRSLAEADACAARLQEHPDPEHDDVQVFERIIDSAPIAP